MSAYRKAVYIIEEATAKADDFVGTITKMQDADLVITEHDGKIRITKERWGDLRLGVITPEECDRLLKLCDEVEVVS